MIHWFPLPALLFVVAFSEKGGWEPQNENCGLEILAGIHGFNQNRPFSSEIVGSGRRNLWNAAVLSDPGGDHDGAHNDCRPIKLFRTRP